MFWRAQLLQTTEVVLLVQLFGVFHQRRQRDKLVGFYIPFDKTGDIRDNADKLMS